MQVETNPVDALSEVFESVARRFSVLGEPTRLRILHALCQEERCVTEIIHLSGVAQANASRHLGLMYQSGLLSRRREGTQVFYKVVDPTCLDLCRAVSIQMGGCAEGPSLSRTGSGPLPLSPNPQDGDVTPRDMRLFPVNQKEATSV